MARGIETTPSPATIINYIAAALMTAPPNIAPTVGNIPATKFAITVRAISNYGTLIFKLLSVAVFNNFFINPLKLSS